MLPKKDGIEPTAVRGGVLTVCTVENGCVHGTFHPITTRYNSSNMMGPDTTRIREFIHQRFGKAIQLDIQLTKLFAVCFPPPSARDVRVVREGLCGGARVRHLRDFVFSVSGNAIA